MTIWQELRGAAACAAGATLGRPAIPTSARPSGATWAYQVRKHAGVASNAAPWPAGPVYPVSTTRSVRYRLGDASMASDEPPAWPPRGDPGLDRAVLAQDEAGAPSVLDQGFDATSLSALRVSMQACAAQAGMSADRATDVVIALHELAANAVRHGAGSGRLRVWDRVGVLYRRVDDVGPAWRRRLAGDGLR